MKHTAMYDSFCVIDFSLSLEGFGFITLLPFRQIPSLNGLNLLGENEKIESMRLRRAYEEKSDRECENADQRRMKKERTFSFLRQFRLRSSRLPLTTKWSFELSARETEGLVFIFIFIIFIFFNVKG